MTTYEEVLDLLEDERDIEDFERMYGREAEDD